MFLFKSATNFNSVPVAVRSSSTPTDRGVNWTQAGTRLIKPTSNASGQQQPKIRPKLWQKNQQKCPLVRENWFPIRGFGIRCVFIRCVMWVTIFFGLFCPACWGLRFYFFILRKEFSWVLSTFWIIFYLILVGYK